EPLAQRIRRGINRIQDLPVGTRTMRLISILKKNWKDVTKEEKNFCGPILRNCVRKPVNEDKKITRPLVGPKGYWGFEKRCNYCLARAPRDKVGIKPLPAELIDVSNKLVQAASELSQSSNGSKSRVDPLIMVLGPEHGGRTRGSAVIL
nr:hypothetical protein [Tanacetum cinerariifolium]